MFVGNFMKKFFKSSLISSVGLAILGILLIFQSELTIVSISYIIGAILIGIGALAIFKYIKGINDNMKTELDIVYGIVCAVLGVIVIGNPHGIASIIPFVIGLIIIISSATKLQYSIELKRNNNDLWKSTMIISIITIVCGILLIFNPFQGAVFITKVVGLLILLYSILDIISTVTIRNTVKQIHEAIEEHINEAEIVNEEVEDNNDEEVKTNKKTNKKKNKKKNKKEDEQ